MAVKLIKLRNTAHELEQFKIFMGLLNDCSSVEEFSIMCSMNGYGEWATKKFFDEKIFPFLFECQATRGAALRIHIELMRSLKKLQMIYRDLIDEI